MFYLQNSENLIYRFVVFYKNLQICISIRISAPSYVFFSYDCDMRSEVSCYDMRSEAFWIVSEPRDVIDNRLLCSVWEKLFLMF